MEGQTAKANPTCLVGKGTAGKEGKEGKEEEDREPYPTPQGSFRSK